MEYQYVKIKNAIEKVKMGDTLYRECIKKGISIYGTEEQAIMGEALKLNKGQDGTIKLPNAHISDKSRSKWS